MIPIETALKYPNASYVRYVEPKEGVDRDNNPVDVDVTITMTVEDAINYMRMSLTPTYNSIKMCDEDLLKEYINIHWAKLFTRSILEY